MIDFQTHPDRYRHWQISYSDRVAYLTMSVDLNAGLSEGYELKLNSYDLGVDIELYDAVQRLRFERPEIGAVVIQSSLDRVFCAGANIKMLGQSSHAHKVNFCKFTNETRNAIEDASENSSQRYISAINGTAAGGGYELALSTDHIILVDDGNASVSLPEVPLLAVLPGTGGLTRLVDKRKVRRDLADVFCTIEEGIKGQRALEWRLVDELVPTSQFQQAVSERANEFAQMSDRPAEAPGITLTSLQREISADEVDYSTLRVVLDRTKRLAELTIIGPDAESPKSIEEMISLGDQFWPLRLGRELDDALLHLRLNETEIGTLVVKSEGTSERIQAFEKLLLENSDHWLVREIILYWKRTLKRLDVTSKTTFTLVEPGSCFSGFLAELIFAADRAYMLEGEFEDRPGEYATLRLSDFNFGPLPMANGITRLQTRFLGEPEAVDRAEDLIGQDLSAGEALAAGLITYAPDDIDWDDEIRLLLEERSSFSADSLTGLEANLRFAGPETMETKIFGRLSAWQNWIFQRPNAVSEEGALQLYGSGIRPKYNPERV
ncbi:MAG: 2,3-epoxybenzoyl-CoA dihydrolase [Arenicellales bacterium]|nr:2,3-epoxybenzoyl-CoA dihydrolase [Arenicellales bacterium]